MYNTRNTIIVILLECIIQYFVLIVEESTLSECVDVEEKKNVSLQSDSCIPVAVKVMFS